VNEDQSCGEELGENTGRFLHGEATSSYETLTPHRDVAASAIQHHKSARVETHNHHDNVNVRIEQQPLVKAKA